MTLVPSLECTYPLGCCPQSLFVSYSGHLLSGGFDECSSQCMGEPWT